MNLISKILFNIKKYIKINKKTNIYKNFKYYLIVKKIDSVWLSLASRNPAIILFIKYSYKCFTLNRNNMFNIDITYSFVSVKFVVITFNLPTLKYILEQSTDS